MALDLPHHTAPQKHASTKMLHNLITSNAKSGQRVSARHDGLPVRRRLHPSVKDYAASVQVWRRSLHKILGWRVTDSPRFKQSVRNSCDWFIMAKKLFSFISFAIHYAVRLSGSYIFNGFRFSLLRA